MRSSTIAAGMLVKFNRLGPHFGVSAGDGSAPVAGSSTGRPVSGSGGLPRTGSGGLPRTGSGGLPRTGSGGLPRTGSGDGGCCRLDSSEVMAVVLGPGACGERSGPTMPFQVDTQEESNWCWAAVTSAVDRYYNPDSFMTQCEVVAEIKQADEACFDPDRYNKAGILEDVLNDMGMGRPFKNAAIDFPNLESEIDAGRPVCVAIDWEGGGTHFVVLCGYQQWTNGGSTLETVDVADPFYPDSTCILDKFTESYHGRGTWVQTYLTR